MTTMAAFSSLSLAAPASLSASSGARSLSSVSSGISTSVPLRTRVSATKAVKAAGPRAQFREKDGDSTGKRPAETARDASADLRKGAENAVDDVSSRAQSAGQGLQERAEGVSDDAQNVFQKAKGAVQDAAESVFGGAKEAGQEAQARGQQAWEEGSDRVKDASNTLQSKGEQALDQASDKAGDVSEKVQSKGEQAWEGAKDTASDASEGVGSFPEGKKKHFSGMSAEGGNENLQTAISGDVKGWTSSGNVTADYAEKVGKSEGEIIADRLVDRADKGT